MHRRNAEPPEIPPGFTLGAKLDLSSWVSGEIVLDLAGNIHCFLGYMRDDQPLDNPYYAPSVAVRDNNGRASSRFVTLKRGTIEKSSFLRDDAYYRVLKDRWLVLPRGSSSDFGVVSRDEREEDFPLTRSVFGGTRSEIEVVAIALAEISGRKYHEMAQLPRLTFSKTRSNPCDISGCLIPKDFPYIAFEDAQYDWSHVSLYGFYRLLQFLCSTTTRSPVWRTLIDSGVEDEVLRVFMSNAAGVVNPIAYPGRY